MLKNLKTHIRVSLHGFEEGQSPTVIVTKALQQFMEEEIGVGEKEIGKCTYEIEGIKVVVEEDFEVWDA